MQVIYNMLCGNIDLCKFKYKMIAFASYFTQHKYACIYNLCEIIYLNSIVQKCSLEIKI